MRGQNGVLWTRQARCIDSWTMAPAGAACTGPAQDQARQHSSTGEGGAHELMAARAGTATWLLVGWPCSSG